MVTATASRYHEREVIVSLLLVRKLLSLLMRVLSLPDRLRLIALELMIVGVPRWMISAAYELRARDRMRLGPTMSGRSDVRVSLRV